MACGSGQQWVIRDRVELAAGPAMSAMLRKRKQNQSIGIGRGGPGFQARARPWLRSRRARLGHLVVVDRLIGGPRVALVGLGGTFKDGHFVWSSLDDNQ
jgi:hypothetical protein